MSHLFRQLEQVSAGAKWQTTRVNFTASDSCLVPSYHMQVTKIEKHYGICLLMRYFTLPLEKGMVMC